MQPNFLIIGPPKCASTSLHFYLGQHPEIYVSKIKEPHFFSDFYNKGIDFYEKYFKDAGNAKAIGEATPDYCFLPFAMDRIKYHYPSIKLIICFRNPVERAFSHWQMLWSAGIEKATFEEAIDINIKQLEYIHFEGLEGEKIWKNKPDTVDKGESWVRAYIEPGMYATILKSLQNKFNTEQIRYFFMDDLKNDFVSTIKDLFTFLEVTPEFSIPIREEQNVHYDRKPFRIASKIIGAKNTRQIAKRLPKNIKDIFRRKKLDKIELPKITDKEYQKLWEVYRKDIEELEKITNRDLSNWRPK